MVAHERPAHQVLRLVWHQRPQLERKIELGEAFGAGLPKGVDYRIVYEFDRPLDVDYLVLFGIGGVAKTIWDAYRSAGIPTIFIDKGYTRNRGLWRVSVRDHQPLAYFAQNRPHDRLNKLGIELAPYHGGSHILFDGASNKFCTWKDMGDWQDWGRSIVEKIRQHSKLPIIYRPRPRHHHEMRRPLEIPGTELSIGPLDDDLARARVCVSFGGAIGVDAVVSGTPHFAIGDSIARPLSETDWSRLDKPFIPTDEQRLQWLADVAYTQFTVDEFRSGVAWASIEPALRRR